MLFPEGDDKDGSVLLFNPEEEERIYRTKRDFSGFQFLANSGKWFLVIDSRFNLYIIDVFSENRIDLLPLEESLLDKADLRGLLWVDEKTAEYVVVLFFNFPSGNVCFCKKGDDRYTKIPVHCGVRWILKGLTDAVLWGYRLYICTELSFIRILDCFLQLKIVALRLQQEERFCWSRASIGSHRRFCIFKNIDYNPQVEVDSLGDEALLLDLGIPVPSIAPNIYFTCHGRIYHNKHFNLDICVFNLETKTLKRFASLANMKLKDARWFVPGI